MNTNSCKWIVLSHMPILLHWRVREKGTVLSALGKVWHTGTCTGHRDKDRTQGHGQDTGTHRDMDRTQGHTGTRIGHRHTDTDRTQGHGHIGTQRHTGLSVQRTGHKCWCLVCARLSRVRVSCSETNSIRIVTGIEQISKYIVGD